MIKNLRGSMPTTPKQSQSGQGEKGQGSGFGNHGDSVVNDVLDGGLIEYGVEDRNVIDTTVKVEIVPIVLT